MPRTPDPGAFAPVRELQKLTRAYPVYADKRIEVLELISVSAGKRGLQILLPPADYLRVLKAMRAAIAVSNL
jgi:prolyl-tRNA editing enzyme YbaK/EbsC (Cys-tRNA(Pro) deacylase)